MGKSAYFHFAFTLLLILTAGCQPGSKESTPVVGDLRVEYMTNPLGVDLSRPRFSWKIISQERGVAQGSWRIIVGKSLSEVRKGQGSQWDSGRKEGDVTINHEYAGAPLEDHTTYYWRAGILLANGREVWSKPGFFQTGIIDSAKWQARWITTPSAIVHECPLLRKTFTVGKKVDRAVAYVTACGFYEFFVNGKKVGDHVLDPGITDYRKTVLYSTYDVTSLIRKGENAAGAMLGNGAWNLRKTEGRWSWGSGEDTFGNPCFLMQLVITFKDGSQSVIVSDETWKSTPGPITFNNLYGGEDYDARRELPGWAEKGFDDTAWTSVVVAQGPGGALKSQLMPAIKVTATLDPIRQINPEKGVYLFDLGQNMAGWWRLEVKGSPGQVIRIRGAETLNDSLFPKPLEEEDRLSTKFKYHAETWTDYTLRSHQTEIYEPRFFYTGFRYIEVRTGEDNPPEHLRVQGRVVRSAVERTGSFQSSDSLLNRIYRAGVWSQMSNAQSYPTDCPHREKGAYNGDGQVIAETSMHDFLMAPFYTKWLSDMRDSQQENGRIPNTSPVLVGGMGGGVAWGSAYILLPWWMNHYYRDDRILKEHYPFMKRYLTYLRELGSKDENPGEPYIIDNFDGYWYSLGEWCSPGRNDCPNHPVVNTFYYYNNSLLLSEIATMLGHSEDAAYYRALSDTIKEAFNRKFFNPETALYGAGETYQTYQLIALAGNLVPEAYRERVFKTITDDIRQRDDHLNTGIVGTKYLWPALVNGGENELAFRVATQTTYPGYGHWILNGSTTLLEEWSGANSHNHQMFGSVSEYFYKFLAGIQSPMEGNTSKGYSQVLIKPYVPEKLQSAAATVQTLQGSLSSEWVQEPESFTHHVTVPANSKALVSIPIMEKGHVVVHEGKTKIWENGVYFEGVKGIDNVAGENDRLNIATRSGDYRFRITYR